MKIFLSYAAEDGEQAHVIAEALRDEGHDVYPAKNWPQDVRVALKRAEAFVVLLSPAAVGSPYVNKEIKLALVSEGIADRLIPVVLHPSTDVPWILQTMQPIPAKPNPKSAAEAINRRLGGKRAAHSTRSARRGRPSTHDVDERASRYSSLTPRLIEDARRIWPDSFQNIGLNTGIVANTSFTAGIGISTSARLSKAATG